jgi:hypothetical protein
MQRHYKIPVLLIEFDESKSFALHVCVARQVASRHEPA